MICIRRANNPMLCFNVTYFLLIRFGICKEVLELLNKCEILCKEIAKLCSRLPCRISSNELICNNHIRLHDVQSGTSVWINLKKPIQSSDFEYI